MISTIFTFDMNHNGKYWKSIKWPKKYLIFDKPFPCDSSSGDAIDLALLISRQHIYSLHQLILTQQKYQTSQFLSKTNFGVFCNFLIIKQHKFLRKQSETVMMAPSAFKAWKLVFLGTFTVVKFSLSSANVSFGVWNTGQCTNMSWKSSKSVRPLHNRRAFFGLT